MTPLWLREDVRDEDNLQYVPNAKFVTELCEGDPSHAKRSRAERPLKLIAPVNALSDIQWTVYGDCIVTEHVKAVFENHGVSGVQFAPVECYTTTLHRFGGVLYEMQAVGWGGMAHSDSGITVKSECRFCGRRVYTGYTSPQKLLDIDAWDGSDVFIVWPLPRYIFVTEEVAALVQASRFSGASPTPLGKMPRVVAGTLSPGHIEDWILGERGKQLAATI